MAWTDKYVSPAGAGSHDGSSAGNAWTLAEAIAAVAAGQRVNVIAGTYANTTSSLTFATPGTDSAPIWWRGYNTTIGDIDANNALTKPAITFTTGQMISTAAMQIFSNLNVSGAPAAALLDTSSGATDNVFFRCRFENTDAAASRFAVTTGAANQIFSACYLKATSSSEVLRLWGNGSLFGCSIRGGTRGVYVSATAASIVNCVFDTQATHAIYCDFGVCNVIGCSIYNAGTDGVRFDDTANCRGLIANNVIFTCGGYGVNSQAGASNKIRLVANAFRACTLGETNNISEATNGLKFLNTSLGSDPFTNPSGHDFSIGTVAKAIGFPGAFENESYAGYLDAGAVQRQEPSGGGGGGGGIFF